MSNYLTGKHINRVRRCCRLIGVRVVAAIAGLGRLFASSDAGIRSLGTFPALPTGAGAPPDQEDQQSLTQTDVIALEQCRPIRGSGERLPFPTGGDTVTIWLGTSTDVSTLGDWFHWPSALNSVRAGATAL